MASKKIIVSVTNDLTTDQRVSKICDTLLAMDYTVTLVGRKLPYSKTIERPYPIKRFKLWFNKGPLFYANYSIRLYWYLLFHSFDVLWSNDLDTLWPNYAISKLKRKRLVFDSHEYFTEVPELVNRKKTQRFWKRIEQRILPKLKTVFTVSESIAQRYRDEYNIKVNVLRNVPFLQQKEVNVSPLPTDDCKIILYQGAINLGRGIELMVDAMEHLDKVKLVLIGTGDIVGSIQQRIKENELEDKVMMLGEIPHENLAAYTKQADLGLSLEEDMGLNYRFALPNKLFNYVHAEIPSLVSDLPEMSRLVTDFNVGETIINRNPEELANQIAALLADEGKISSYKTNCTKAKQVLNWEEEKKVILAKL